MLKLLYWNAEMSCLNVQKVLLKSADRLHTHLFSTFPTNKSRRDLNWVNCRGYSPTYRTESLKTSSNSSIDMFIVFAIVLSYIKCPYDFLHDSLEQRRMTISCSIWYLLFHEETWALLSSANRLLTKVQLLHHEIRFSVFEHSFFWLFT
jgi:hypothetical protein